MMLLFKLLIAAALLIGVANGDSNSSIDLLNVEYKKLSLAAVNMSEDLISLLESNLDGNLVPGETRNIMTSLGDSDAAVVTALYRVARKSKTMTVRQVAAEAVAARADLDRAILRSVLEAVPSELINITLGTLDGLSRLNTSFEYFEPDTVVDALAITDNGVFFSLAQSIAKSYPELHQVLISHIQEQYAEETVSQVLGPSGGTLYSAEGDLKVVVPEMALDRFHTLSIYKYDCQLVSFFNQPDDVPCYGIAPHGVQFQKKVTAYFKIPDDGQRRKCWKAKDEIGEEWEVVDCYTTREEVTYISDTFSVITARVIERETYIPEPDIQQTIVEMPEELNPTHPKGDQLPFIRFKRFHERTKSGKHNEFLKPVEPDQDIAGEYSGINVAMAGLAINEKAGLVYWANGFEIQYANLKHAVVRTPFEGAPVVLLPGITKLEIFGKNLGTSFENLIGVRVGENVDCKIHSYVSSEKIECVIESDDEKVSRTPFDSITLESILVSTRRRDKTYNRGIPEVTRVRVHPRGRRPSAIYYDEASNAMFYAESESKSIFVNILHSSGTKFTGTPWLLLDDGPYGSLHYNHEDGYLYFSQVQGGRISRVLLHANLSKSGKEEVIADNEEDLTDFCVDYLTNRLYLTRKYGQVKFIDLNAPSRPKSLLRLPSKTRLSAISVSSSSRVLYIADQEASNILSVPLNDPYRWTVKVKSTIWVSKIIVHKHEMYWTEYLGRLWGVSTNRTHEEAFLAVDIIGVQKNLAREISNVQTGFLELVAL